MKRLLILSVSAGAGHTRAAEALEEAARGRGDLEVERADILDFTQSLYRKGYVKSYLEMVNRAPALWGYLYRASDRGKRPGVEAKLVRLFDQLEFARFRKYVRDVAPDAVLTTHFLACQVFAPYRRRGRDRFPLGVVVTDFDAHAFWVQPTADRFFVASAEVAALLRGRGIAGEKVSATGIPVMKAFGRRYQRRVQQVRLGLSPDRPAVLVMSGGAAVGAFEQVVISVLAAGPVEVLAVCGRNEKARRRLEAVRPPAGSSLRAFGFVDDIASLMAACDLAVGKSGGLTTAECLAMGLPLVVFDPIPGQEERNADFLLEMGAGVKAIGPVSLSYKTKTLLSDEGRRRAMSQNARQAGRPRAASEIVQTMCQVFHLA